MPTETTHDPQPLSIREIRAQYPGEWLLISILEQPGISLDDAPGQLLAHGLTRAAMFKAERKIRKSEPRAMLAILAGGTGFEDGDELRRALARVAAEEEFVSVNPW